MESKNVTISARITENTAEKLEELVKKFQEESISKVSKSHVVEHAIKRLHEIEIRGGEQE